MVDAAAWQGVALLGLGLHCMPLQATMRWREWTWGNGKHSMAV